MVGAGLPTSVPANQQPEKPAPSLLSVLIPSAFICVYLRFQKNQIIVISTYIENEKNSHSKNLLD
jgi:hypothetical protein